MKATGAELITNIEDLTPDVLGKADYIHQEKVFDQILTFIEGCEDPTKYSSICNEFDKKGEAIFGDDFINRYADKEE